MYTLENWEGKEQGTFKNLKEIEKIHKKCKGEKSTIDKNYRSSRNNSLCGYNIQTI